MTHPYDSQPPRAFWRQAIGERSPREIGDWYRPRFGLEGKRIATVGSCFAQHVGRALREGGFDFVDMEPAPSGLAAGDRSDWGYGLYSARYGNVYTTRQLVQLFDRALGRFAPVEDWWERDGGVVDPFRPTIEPEPFGSVAEMRALRADHLDRVAAMIGLSDVLIVTLGLTEAWFSRTDGACFPLCPGVAGGVWDAARHGFANLDSLELRADMEALIATLRALNPAIEIVLTVSPVSLMATATAQQVSVATCYSKSVLRAVAGELHAAHGFVDYFPAYDIVAGPAARGAFYKPDMREVSPEGVAHVMAAFLGPHRAAAPAPGKGTGSGREPAPVPEPPVGAVTLRPRMAPGLESAARERPAREPSGASSGTAQGGDDIKCDEEILNAFGKPDART